MEEEEITPYLYAMSKQPPIRIWIEYEFTTLNQNQSLDKMKEKYGITDINQFINIPDSNIKFAIDEEYYDSIYEIKTYPSPNFTTNISKIQDFIRENTDKSIYLQNPWPNYVGTHIHIFKDFEKKENRPPLVPVLSEVFHTITNFMIDFTLNPYVNHINKVRELKRLVQSNNLIKYLDHNYLKDSLKLMTRNNNIYFSYDSVWIDNPKYQPVIYSPKRNQKNYSIEIRYIPNTYFLLSKPEEITNFLKRIIKINEDTRINTPPDELLEKQIESILKNYYILINLLTYVSKNNHCNLLNIEAIREKPLPLELRNISQEIISAFYQDYRNEFPQDNIPF